MMIKNRIIKVFFTACILITLCNTAFSQSRKEKKAARAAELEQFVVNGNSNKDIYIDIYKICPQGQATRSSSTGYYLSIKDNTFSCYLPYIGAYKTAAIGDLDLSITSKNQVISLAGGFNKEEKSFIYQFRFFNEAMHENTLCTVQIYNDAECAMRLEMNSREPISYLGKMEARPLKTQEN